MVITTKQGVKLLITRGLVGLLKIKVSLLGSTIGTNFLQIHQCCGQDKVKRILIKAHKQININNPRYLEAVQCLTLNQEPDS